MYISQSINPFSAESRHSDLNQNHLMWGVVLGIFCFKFQDTNICFPLCMPNTSGDLTRSHTHTPLYTLTMWTSSSHSICGTSYHLLAWPKWREMPLHLHLLFKQCHMASGLAVLTKGTPSTVQLNGPSLPPRGILSTKTARAGATVPHRGCV